MHKRFNYHLKKIFRSIGLGLALFLMGVFLHPILGIQSSDLPFYEKIRVDQIDTSIDDQKVIELLNQYRTDHDKKPLIVDDRLCESAKLAIEQVESEQELDDMLSNCPDCYNITVLTLTGTYKESEILESWKDQQSQAILEDSSVICAAHHTNTVAVALGNLKRDAKKSVTIPLNSSQPNITEIPDQEVIEALNQYRAAHSVPALNIDQHLCKYAEKRTRDLVAHGGLDGHAGFSADFEDGNVPEELRDYPGRGIGENLAHQYCYRGSKNVIANTGTALIEWCFDSSTMGHREAQLNPKYNAVCVRHAENMYVVIFGE